MHLALNDYLGNANDSLAAGEAMLSGYEEQLAAYGRSLKTSRVTPAKIAILAGVLVAGIYLFRKYR